MVTDNFGCQYDAFISYSSKDLSWVKNVLLRRLEDNGLKVCIDYRDFIPGSWSIKNIEQAVLTSRKTLLVITPNYLESTWTEFEAMLVQTTDPTNQQLRFLPLFKEKCDLPLRLASLTYLNFANPEDEELEWERLLSAIKEQPFLIKYSKPLERPLKSEKIRLQNCMKDVFRSEDDLRGFCFDHFEEVYRNLKETDRLPYIVREIINHCKSRGSTDVLWNLLRQRSPKITSKNEI